MDIRDCYDCGEYKYIEKDGLCRSCFAEDSVIIGKNNGPIFMDYEDFKYGVNVYGSDDYVCNKWINDITSQLSDKTNTHYINYNNKGINETEYDRVIDIGNNDFINLFTTIRDEDDNMYKTECRRRADIILDLITCGVNQLSPVNVKIANMIIQSMITANGAYGFSDLNRIIKNERFRKNVIEDSDINKKTKKRVIEGPDDGDPIIKSIEKFVGNPELERTLFSLNPEMNIEEALGEDILYNFDDNSKVNNLTGLSIISSIFMEIKNIGSTNNQCTFVLNDVCNYHDYNSIEQIQRHTRHYNCNFINRVKIPYTMPQWIFTAVHGGITFKSVNASNRKTISRWLDVSSRDVSDLGSNEFIAKIGLKDNVQGELRDNN